MGQYLIDTNSISDYLSASLPEGGLSLIDSVINTIPKISIITQIELLCWNTDDETLQKVKDFISDCIILNISTDVISACVRIRRGKKIKTPDAIIAATALVYNFKLITNNEKDIANIKGLIILNPYKV